MLRFLAVALFAAVAYGSVLPSVPQFAMDWDRSESVQEGRIVGGQNADIREAPYQVAALFSRTGGSFSQSCGASIIRTTAVLCAAHCSVGTSASMWQMRAGSTFSNSGGQLRAVNRIVNHAQYNGNTVDYDISILFVPAFSIDSVTTRLVPLPAQNAGVADNAPAFVTGWGSTREGGPTVTTLQKVTIPIVNQNSCANAYAGFNTITTRMICAGHLASGGQDACQGDSGGPLTVNGVLIGVTSWGRGCARPGSPGVWARVPFFRNWIDSIN